MYLLYSLNSFSSLKWHLSQVPAQKECYMLSTFKINGALDCRWADRFMPCLEDGSTLSELITPPSGAPFIDLHSVTCVRYALSEDLSCSCQMDCLFSFQGTSTALDKVVYAHLPAISCNGSQVNEVKAFLHSPHTFTTYVNGSVPPTPCNMTG